MVAAFRIDAENNKNFLIYKIIEGHNLPKIYFYFCFIFILLNRLSCLLGYSIRAVV